MPQEGRDGKSRRRKSKGGNHSKSRRRRTVAKEVDLVKKDVFDVSQAFQEKSALSEISSAQLKEAKSALYQVWKLSSSLKMSRLRKQLFALVAWILQNLSMRRKSSTRKQKRSKTSPTVFTRTRKQTRKQLRNSLKTWKNTHQGTRDEIRKVKKNLDKSKFFRRVCGRYLFENEIISQ